MSSSVNQYQQPIGFPLPEWTPRLYPPQQPLEGRTCRLEPLSAQQHAEGLWAAWSQAADERDWTWMFSGPFPNYPAFCTHISAQSASQDALHFAVIDRQSLQPVGTLALMRIDPQHGSMEVGHVAFSPRLKRTTMATEAHFLLMALAFDELGYRRYEWKCDSLNAASRQAALRLGFQYEGLFRQAAVYKGRNRDTAWFSIIDGEWPTVSAALRQWLAAENFDVQGQQRRSLQAFRAQALHSCPRQIL
ncbi:GNAT family N-acetyltransferase [Mixta theicola]|uniref:GNAT family N-acetyltransferase n=1 Tax=Mixta theicola TaxID=1458355 RepID=A0A2K1Q5C7_9GAMM|nr:GNAT family protein [Mixta theicola]PNS10201.1 GNAT family N-acetyltransferase [Mixta theicola]GLR08505.1 N-acetyltransferase [Mixta theicola]